MTLDKPESTLELREKDPAHYAVVIAGEKKKVMNDISHGSREWAICMNMWSGEIYIGSDHANMRAKFAIPQRAYCAGIADVDFQTKQVILRNSFDYRTGTLKELGNPNVINALTQALQKGLFGES